MSNQQKQFSKYKSLAEFFESIEQYQLAALFYQISENSVDSDLFVKAFNHYRDQDYSLGIMINRRQTSGEVLEQQAGSLINFITGVILKIFDFLGALLLLVPLVLVWIVKLVIQLIAQIVGLLIDTEVTRPNPDIVTVPHSARKHRWLKLFFIAITSCLLFAGLSLYKPQINQAIAFITKNVPGAKRPPLVMTEDLRVRAIQKFPDSYESINITKNLLKSQGSINNSIQPEMINLAIFQTLCMTDQPCLEHQVLSKQVDKFSYSEKENLIKTIYKYEQKNGINSNKVDGIVLSTDDKILDKLMKKSKTKYEEIDSIFENARKDKNFDDTRVSIQEIVRSNINIIEEKKVKENLKIGLGIPKVSYAQTIEVEGDKNFRDLWIKAIYLFQLKNVSDIKDLKGQEGIVKEDSDTYNKIKESLQLKIAREQFTETLTGLNSIQDKVLTALSKDPENIEILKLHYAKKTITPDEFQTLFHKKMIVEQIQVALKIPTVVTISNISEIKFDEARKNEWVKAIYYYQQENLSNNPDGIINAGEQGETAKSLITEVTNKVTERIQQGL